MIEGLSIQAGPQIGYLASAKADVDVDGYGSGSDDYKDQTKSIDFSVAGGIGYDLPMGLFFDARYTTGITKVNEGDGDLKNAVVQFSVGYKF